MDTLDTASSRFYIPASLFVKCLGCWIEGSATRNRGRPWCGCGRLGAACEGAVLTNPTYSVVSGRHPAHSHSREPRWASGSAALVVVQLHRFLSLAAAALVRLYKVLQPVAAVKNSHPKNKRSSFEPTSAPPLPAKAASASPAGQPVLCCAMPCHAMPWLEPLSNVHETMVQL